MDVDGLIQLLCNIKDNDNGSVEYQMDKQYNRIGRNQPAYISLLFPIVYFILLIHDSDWWNNQDGVGKYIFNCIAASVLFLPALFFLYKQVIRILSVIIIEVCVFSVFSPVKILFRKLSENDKKRLENKMGGLSLPKVETISSNQKKDGSESLGVAIRYIRELNFIRNNHIVFDNNCVYGFFRNLVGGCSLNLIIYYFCKLFVTSAYFYKMSDYFNLAVPIIWCMLCITIPMAWAARYRHLKREVFLFIDHAGNE